MIKEGLFLSYIGMCRVSNEVEGKREREKPKRARGQKGDISLKGQDANTSRITRTMWPLYSSNTNDISCYHSLVLKSISYSSNSMYQN